MLKKILTRLIRYGTLTVTDRAGRDHVFAGSAGPALSMRLKTRLLPFKLAVNPELYLGEAYMDGTLTVEEGDIYDLLDLLSANLDRASPGRIQPALTRFNRWARALKQFNPVRRARRNAAHHYDLPDELYDVFLDKNRQYSCAYFRHPDDTLEQAQTEKMDHIAGKLCLERGQRILDIGCGWGGLALYLAGAFGSDVTGITLSREQLGYAQRWADARGLARRAHFDLRDYRQIDGKFDRIVSVGMFEHVGPPHYGRFFSALSDALTDDGIALLHTIGYARSPSATNAWIGKYIFPGGYVPSLSEVLPEIEKAGLVVTDIEILRLHYALTLKAWRERFSARRDEVRAKMGERFCRMWDFYLAITRIGFERQGNVVFQIQLARRQDAVPLTRDYLVAFENHLQQPAQMAG